MANQSTVVQKSILPVLILILFSGCSSRELYESTQPKYGENECRQLPPDQYDDCIKMETKSYEEYQKDREEILNKSMRFSF